MNFFENQWIEIFRVGEQSDSQGNTRKWTVSDLEKIVKNYDAKEHEVPLVVGHPKENAPAFGWVEALKTDGEFLFAKFKQLVPEFVEAVKKGLYKKRSISLYPDLTLRHIGFLGAVPPAVKGLADIKFTKMNENNSITIEINAQTKETTTMVEKENTEINELNELKIQLKEEQRKNRISEFKKFVNRLHSEGKIVSEFQNTIVELMEVMFGLGEVNFSDYEAGEEKSRFSALPENKLFETHSEGKINALDKFREYLEKQPKIVDFGEKVKNEKITTSRASEQLNILALRKVKNENISFSEPLSLIQTENIELAQQAAREI